MLVGLNLTLGTQLGHPTETVGIDPKATFKVGPMNGRKGRGSGLRFETMGFRSFLDCAGEESIWPERSCDP